MELANPFADNVAFYSVLLPMPPSVNHLYATVRGRRVLSKEGRNYKSAIGLSISVDMSRKRLTIPSKTAQIGIAALFTFDNNRRTDLDNRLKALLDCLTGLVYPDDSQVAAILTTKRIDKTAVASVIMRVYVVNAKPTPSGATLPLAQPSSIPTP